MGYHFLLQGIFLTQGWNLNLLHCRQMLYHLSHQGSPIQLREFVLHKPALQEILKKVPIPHMFLLQISTPLSLSILSNVTFTVRPCLENPVKITISDLSHFLCPFLTEFNHVRCHHLAYCMSEDCVPNQNTHTMLTSNLPFVSFSLFYYILFLPRKESYKRIFFVNLDILSIHG